MAGAARPDSSEAASKAAWRVLRTVEFPWGEKTSLAAGGRAGVCPKAWAVLRARRSGRQRDQLLLHLVDRVADALAEHRLVVVDQHQPFGGPGHRHIQQARLLGFVLALLGQRTESRDDHE